MRRLPPFDARAVAVTAALAAVSLLSVLLVLRRRDDVLAVSLALLCVLCLVVAGVAAHESRYRRVPGPGAAPEVYVPGTSNIDADTLDTFDSREALHAVDVRQRRAGRLTDR